MDDFFPKNKKTPRRAFTAQILRSIKRPAEQIKYHVEVEITLYLFEKRAVLYEMF